MEHNQITKEWIDQQRAVCEEAQCDAKALLADKERRGNTQQAYAIRLCMKPMECMGGVVTYALDALEAAYAEIKRLKRMQKQDNT